LPDELKEQLHELLLLEKALYEELDGMVGEEERSVQEENWSALLAILQDKQSLISRQEILQESWNGFSSLLDVHGGRESPAFWDAVAKRVGESAYKEMKALIHELRSLAAGTLERERRVQETLENHLEDLRKRMLQMQQGKQAFQGYLKSGSSIAQPRSSFDSAPKKTLP
jgi:HD-GYP domain-containing protein (c-di-GMP phosphodiesterase class II)